VSQPNHVQLYIERRKKGLPAGNKARCNRTNTPYATQSEANQTPQTHTRGVRQA
jgi:hypothetical protein